MSTHIRLEPHDGHAVAVAKINVALAAHGLVLKQQGITEECTKLTLEQNTLGKNKDRDLWLKELDTDGDPTGNALFIPQGWCDEFTFASGFNGGPDYDPHNEDHVAVAEGPEIYCYGPTAHGPNSDVDTMFFSITDLDRYPEITEEEGRKLHPKLAAFLNSINAVE